MGDCVTRAGACPGAQVSRLALHILAAGGPRKTARRAWTNELTYTRLHCSSRDDAMRAMCDSLLACLQQLLARTPSTLFCRACVQLRCAPLIYTAACVFTLFKRHGWPILHPNKHGVCCQQSTAVSRSAAAASRSTLAQAHGAATAKRPPLVQWYIG